MADHKNKRKRIEKLKRRYKLALMDTDSFEEKLSVNLTRLGVISVSLLLFLIFLVITIYLIAFTSLREYIPGYADVDLPAKLYALNQKTDSLQEAFRVKDQYINNLKSLIRGDSIPERNMQLIPGNANYDTIQFSISKEDSLLREAYDAQTRFNIYQNQAVNYTSEDLGNQNFFPPLSGIITRRFNAASDHFGIDIVANQSEAIKATLDGMVVFSDWTLETGYVIALQHKNNLISVYKHNSVLLKQQGTFVKAGETISIVGESGELSTGPHLHFELWYNGKPLNPEDFIAF